MVCSASFFNKLLLVTFSWSTSKGIVSSSCEINLYENLRYAPLAGVGLQQPDRDITVLSFFRLSSRHSREFWLSRMPHWKRSQVEDRLRGLMAVGDTAAEQVDEEEVSLSRPDTLTRFPVRWAL